MVTFSLPLNATTDFATGLFQLEDLLIEEPDALLLRLAGVAPVPPGMAIAYWALINHHRTKTKVIANAFTSLEIGGFLIWLGCHYQIIAPNAYVRISSSQDFNDEGDLLTRPDSYHEDMKSVHRLISNYLNLEEVTGKRLGAIELGELGLLPTPLDDFLEGISIQTASTGKEVSNANLR